MLWLIPVVCIGYIWFCSAILMTGRQREWLFENRCAADDPNFWHNVEEFERVGNHRHFVTLLTLRNPYRLYRFL